MGVWLVVEKEMGMWVDWGVWFLLLFEGEMGEAIVGYLVV